MKLIEQKNYEDKKVKSQYFEIKKEAHLGDAPREFDVPALLSGHLEGVHVLIIRVKRFGRIAQHLGARLKHEGVSGEGVDDMTLTICHHLFLLERTGRIVVLVHGLGIQGTAAFKDMELLPLLLMEVIAQRTDVALDVKSLN